jgi:transcriptional regulator with AAA-type ATPase domain
MWRLVAKVGGRELRHILGAAPVLVGSAPDCDFVLREPTISRRHARLRADGEGVEVEDLDSRNGVFVAERRVSGRQRLRGGDRLRLGEVEVQVLPADASDAEIALAGTAAGAPAPQATTPTLATVPLGRFCAGMLPPLLKALGDGVGFTEFAARLVAALADCEPGAAVELRRGEGIVAMAGHAGAASVRFSLQFEGQSLAFSVPAEAEPLFRELGAIACDLLRIAERDAAGLRSGKIACAGIPPAPPGPATRCPELAEIYRRAALVAPSRINVLIEGETGTGKELMARFLHEASGLPAQRFVALNCAALPRDLLDAELFGIEAGVATGVAARAGRFEQAHGGTLFLDEIADMAADTQARLLRVLQEGVVYRIGGKEARPAEVRVISACNRDLEAMVQSGQFRRDLYHRIADWPLRLPPLRARGADVGNLAAHFLGRECAARGIRFGGIARSALEALLGYTWPGNVRELEREMARVALFLNDGEALDASLLKPAIAAARGVTGADGSLAAGLECEERRLIEAALRACGGNAVAAAQRLGIGKSTLYRRMQQLGVRSESR